jgi:exo-beta-1,3-glucanase (GH17 family)
MATKLDISSLDSATKKKIKQYAKRCEQLANVVYKTVEISFKCKIGAIWDEGDTASRIDGDELDIADTHIEKAQEKYLVEINKEIKQICKFADSVAKKLNVDKEQFWLEYFAH